MNIPESIIHWEGERTRLVQIGESIHPRGQSDSPHSHDLPLAADNQKIFRNAPLTLGSAGVSPSVGAISTATSSKQKTPLTDPKNHQGATTLRRRESSRSPYSPPHTSLSSWLLPRVLELTYTAYDLAPFARDCGYDGPPFRWDEARRFLIRYKLYVAYFHLYGISREDADYILETFPIVKRKDEQRHGEFRTKRVILEIYDAMADSIRTGTSYQTRLDPPPGPPEDGLPQWDAGMPKPPNWPSHIHPPKVNSDAS